MDASRVDTRSPGNVSSIKLLINRKKVFRFARSH